MIFKLFENKNFRNYFLSDIIADFGVGMLTTSLNWFVIDKTGSSKMLGYLLSINVIAGLIISLFVGLLVDKFNRKFIVIVNYLVRIISMIAVVVLLSLTEFNLAYAFLLTVINGVCWNVTMAVSKSFIQEIIPKKDFISGNSLLEISMQVGMFLAGALSGVIYKFFGFVNILVINTIIFIISTIFIFNIKYKSEVTSKNNETLHENVKEGISYLNNNKSIFAFGAISFVPTIVTAIYNVVLPTYVVSSINGDSVIFGIADMAYGIGGFIAGFLAVFIAKKLTNKKSIVLFYLVAIGILIGICFNKYSAILYMISCTLGITNSSIRILVNTMLMDVVPKEVMGRSMSVWVSISLIVQAVSSLVVGELIDAYSPEVGFVFMGLLMFIGLIFNIFLFKKFKIREVEN
ncbi:MFS transporter [uncultured Clostridium sp.]|uniref:MFS transporter n=1 Tax=uncultured Clostridium sp. TaxID=59620 RepID=UPI0025E18D01|nr:MFS transporter [uncultured Clostridium sp.]